MAPALFPNPYPLFPSSYPPLRRKALAVGHKRVALGLVIAFGGGAHDGVGPHARHGRLLERAGYDHFAHLNTIALGGKVVKPDAAQLKHAPVEVVGSLVHRVLHAAQGVGAGLGREVALKHLGGGVEIAKAQFGQQLQRYLAQPDFDILAQHLVHLGIEAIVVVDILLLFLGGAVHGACKGKCLGCARLVSKHCVFGNRGQRDAAQSNDSSLLRHVMFPPPANVVK